MCLILLLLPLFSRTRTLLLPSTISLLSWPHIHSLQFQKEAKLALMWFDVQSLWLYWDSCWDPNAIRGNSGSFKRSRFLPQCLPSSVWQTHHRTLTPGILFFERATGFSLCLTLQNPVSVMRLQKAVWKDRLPVSVHFTIVKKSAKHFFFHSLFNSPSLTTPSTDNYDFSPAYSFEETDQNGGREKISKLLPCHQNNSHGMNRKAENNVFVRAERTTDWKCSKKI